MSVTRRHINYIAASILIIVLMLRIPVADGYFRASWQLIMETSVLFVFALFIAFYVNVWVALFLVLVLFSSIYPNLGRWSYMARNTIFIGIVWYVFVVKFAPNINLLMNIMCVVALVNVLFSVFQAYMIDPYNIFTFGIMKSTSSHPTGLMANKNLLSALLAISLPMFFRRYWKWLVPFIFYGLTVASSLGGSISAFVMCIAYFFLKDGRDFLRLNFIPLFALLIWGIFFVAEIDSPIQSEVQSKNGNIEMASSAKNRFDAWKEGLNLYYHNHPVVGYGIGHWKLAFLKLSKPGTGVMTKAHNEFIQGLFEMGIAFPFIIAGFLYDVIKRYRRETMILFTSFGAIILNSMVNFPFHVATTAMISLTIMAMMETQLKEK